MKKEGDRAKSFVAHVVFIIIVLCGLFFIVTSTANITGHAVLDASTAKAKLESALASSSLFQQVTQSSICVVINDPQQPLSLQAVKTSTGWTVSEMVGFCSGQISEDIIVQFADYDSFSAIVDNPSPRAITQAVINQDFQVLKSKYVELGGNVICDAAFKVKYCPALNTLATPEQLIDGDMACCIDKITSAQKKLLQAHLQQGTYRDEIGILEQPGGGLAGMSMTSIIISVVVLMIIIIGIVVGVMMKGGHNAPSKSAASKGASGANLGIPQGAVSGVPSSTPGTPNMPGMPIGTQAFAQPQPVTQPAESPQVIELKNYVKEVMGQGYIPDEIRTHLLEIGWDESTADNVITDVYNQILQEQSQQQN